MTTTTADTQTRRTYRCYSTDVGEYAAESVRAVSPEAAARQYAEVGSWGQEEGTVWVDVRVRPARPADSEWDTVTVTLEPDEPACEHGHAHDWIDGQATGHGGGVISTDHCARCGLRRTIDTWAQRMDTGEQGLRSVSYDRGEDE